MNQDIILQICEKYDLGTLTGDAASITGGLIHKIWRIETNKGQYAIKELNAQIISKTGVLENFELSENIALQLMFKGVPAIVGIKVSDKFVCSISGIHVIVYDWLEGTTLSSNPVLPVQAILIGNIIGQIHKANLEAPTLQKGLPQVFSNEHWQTLIADFETKFPESELGLEKIMAWNENAQEIINKLQSNLVVSHGDIDQKNVIWENDNHPYIIDWEGVSKTNPELEIIDAALNWGGLGSGTVDETTMKAVIEGYQQAGMAINENPSTLLQGCIIKWLPWLEFNMRRVIESSPDSKEYTLGLSQTQQTLRNLNLISENSKAWRLLLS